MSIVENSLMLTGFFEAEVLVALLLHRFDHPLAENSEFRLALLERASEILQEAVAGEKVVEELEPQDVNFIAALWLAESVQLDYDRECSRDERQRRDSWLSSVRQYLPSCFCDPDELE